MLSYLILSFKKLYKYWDIVEIDYYIVEHKRKNKLIPHGPKYLDFIF